MTEVVDIQRNLAQLDRLDRERWSLQGSLKAEPKAIAADAAAAAALHAEAEALHTRLTTLRKAAREAERDMEAVEKRRDRAKKRMNEIFTSTQIEATQREIAALGEQAGELEELTLQHMEEGEEVETALGTTRASVSAADAALAARRAAWATQEAEANARIAALTEERDPLFTGLRGDVARRYQVGWRHALYSPPSAITQAEGITCTTCNTTISPKWVQESKGYSALHACDSCKRILVFDPAVKD